MSFATSTREQKEQLKKALINATKLVEVAIDAQPGYSAEITEALVAITVAIEGVGGIDPSA